MGHRRSRRRHRAGGAGSLRPVGSGGRQEGGSRTQVSIVTGQRATGAWLTRRVHGHNCGCGALAAFLQGVRGGRRATAEIRTWQAGRGLPSRCPSAEPASRGRARSSNMTSPGAHQVLPRRSARAGAPTPPAARCGGRDEWERISWDEPLSTTLPPRCRGLRQLRPEIAPSDLAAYGGIGEDTYFDPVVLPAERQGRRGAPRHGHRLARLVALPEHARDRRHASAAHDALEPSPKIPSCASAFGNANWAAQQVPAALPPISSITPSEQGGGRRHRRPVAPARRLPGRRRLSGCPLLPGTDTALLPRT
ncbi:MAG: hypothetical protein ACLTDR_14715 [Adlercreutzia equolifaciens]